MGKGARRESCEVRQPKRIFLTEVPQPIPTPHPRPLFDSPPRSGRRCVAHAFSRVARLARDRAARGGVAEPGGLGGIGLLLLSGPEDFSKWRLCAEQLARRWVIFELRITFPYLISPKGVEPPPAARASACGPGRERNGARRPLARDLRRWVGAAGRKGFPGLASPCHERRSKGRWCLSRRDPPPPAWLVAKQNGLTQEWHARRTQTKYLASLSGPPSPQTLLGLTIM